MAQAPIMPVFTDALVGDTTHLSTEQFGAYVLILIATWRNNGKALPDDDEAMAHICRVGIKKWRSKIRPKLAPFFTIGNPGDPGWHQQRLEKEWGKVKRLLKQKASAGQAGGQARGQAAAKQSSIQYPDKNPLERSETPTAPPREAEAEDQENSGNETQSRSARLGWQPAIVSAEPAMTKAGVRPRKSSTTQATIKERLRAKHGRFLLSCGSPGDAEAYWLAMLGDDGDAAQRLFDAVDRRMRVSRWDDREAAA